VGIIRKLAILLFLVSGATGLIYEITWMRLFGTVFGNTVLAASTVLTAFMLGLAVGSWLFGKLADRSRHPLRFYGWLEVAIGAYAFAFPTILQHVDQFYLWFYQTYQPGFYLLNLVRFGVSVVILLLPTAFMGGTLPMLSSLWAIPAVHGESQTGTGRSVGLLYAINSFGAVIGSFLTGYFLIRLWGVSASIYMAAVANTAIGAAALLLSFTLRARRVVRDSTKREQLAQETALAGTRQEEEPAAVYSTGQRRAVLLGVLLAGFCALALEVLWTRLLVFVLATSAYAFACMLTCFILGIAVGSLIASTLLVSRLRNPMFALGIVEFLLALAVAGSVPALGLLWHIDSYVAERLMGGEVSFWRDMAVHFLDAMAIMFLPTLLMGMAFPIAVKACAPVWHVVGQRVGQVYAFNTVGCVLGAFAAGFLMIPWLGMRDSFLVVVGILFFLALFLILLSARRRILWALPVLAISAAVVAAGVLLLPQDVFLRTMNTYHYPSKIVYIKDGITGTVTVHDLPDGDRLIAVDGVDVAGVDLMLRSTQKLQAYVPLLVHEKPQDVVQIGYGSGETCGIGLDFGVARYSIVDICPDIFTAGTFFDEINRRSYDNPRLRKIIMDGKNFIKLTDKKFDVIMNDSTYPGTTGSSALYTYDHFNACRDHLKPGGLLSCWVPLDLRLEDFQIVVRSFQTAMPHSSLWMVNNCLNKHGILLGTLEPTKLDFDRIRQLLARPDIAGDVKLINVHCVYDFLDWFVVGEEGLKALGGDGPLHRDDTPYLEFGASIKRDTEGTWLDVMRAISRYHSPVLSCVTNAGRLPDQTEDPRVVLQQYSEGTACTLRAVCAALQGDPDIMQSQFEMAKKANPQDRDVDYIMDEMRREIKDLEAAVARAPDSADLRARLAQRLLLLRQYKQAAEHYEKFVSLSPGQAAAWNNLGVCYRNVNDSEKAAKAFERAIQWQPGLVPAYTNLAELHANRGDFAAAIKVFERLLPLLPRDRQARAYDFMANLYFQQKQYDLALKHLDMAIDLARDDPQLRQELSANRQRVLKEAKPDGK
jgi:spermidine synthase